jgi:hypothetical protein
VPAVHTGQPRPIPPLLRSWRRNRADDPPRWVSCKTNPRPVRAKSRLFGTTSVNSETPSSRQILMPDAKPSITPFPSGPWLRMSILCMRQVSHGCQSHPHSRPLPCRSTDSDDRLEQKGELRVDVASPAAGITALVCMLTPQDHMAVRVFCPFQSHLFAFCK